LCNQKLEWPSTVKRGSGPYWRRVIGEGGVQPIGLGKGRDRGVFSREKKIKD